MSSEEKPVEVVVDLKSLEERIAKILEDRLSKLAEKPSESGGKGVVEPARNERYAKILEALKHGGLKEQWEAPIRLPEKNTASIMSYVARSNEIRGNLGDTVFIPYVKAVDADVLTSVGGTLSEKTSLYGVVQTTLKEAALYTSIPYSDIEKLSEDLIAQLEAQFENAIIRAIDKAILDMLLADTGVPELDKTSAAVAFDADWIAEALYMVAGQGKALRPSDFILVLGPTAYKDLYMDIAGTQALVYARPDVVREGLVAEFMGIPIVVSTYLPEHASSKASCYLIHKNAVVFAPKREMLFETERDTVNRKVKLTGSYTFGIALVDNKAVCEIKTNFTA
jgi:hypothetical protein